MKKHILLVVIVSLGLCFISGTNANAQFTIKDTTDETGNPLRLQVNNLTQSPHRIWNLNLNIERFGTSVNAIVSQNFISQLFSISYEAGHSSIKVYIFQ